MDAEFKVPIALAPDGSPTRPGRARSGIAYRCIACDTRLAFVRAHLRRGFDVSAHFAHPASNTCGHEAVDRATHERAKAAIIRLVDECLAGSSPPPIIWRPCRHCGGTLLEDHLPPGIARARDEFTLGNRRIDVSLLDADGRPLLLIEVYRTSEVDEAKARDLREHAWIEVDATQILDDPSAWLVRQHGGAGSDGRMCTACINRAEWEKRQAERVEASLRRYEAERAAGVRHRDDSIQLALLSAARRRSQEKPPSPPRALPDYALSFEAFKAHCERKARGG